MKAVVIAAGLAVMTFATPVYASWAESANGPHAVHTGSNASLNQENYASHHGAYAMKHRSRYHSARYR